MIVLQPSLRDEYLRINKPLIHATYYGATMNETITQAFVAAAPYVCIVGVSAVLGIGVERLITKSLEALRRDLGFPVPETERPKLKGPHL